MRISDWSSDVCSSDLPRPICCWPTMRPAMCANGWRKSWPACRSEERRVGKECVVRVDLGGRRIIKKKTYPQPIKKHGSVSARDLNICTQDPLHLQNKAHVS